MLKFNDVTTPSTPANDPDADFDDPWLNVRNLYCTEHELVEDAVLAAYFAHGRWAEPLQDHTINTAALIEVLINHLTDDGHPLTQEQADASRSMAALGAPVEALSMLMEFDPLTT